ncbi:transcriptional repressor [Catenovulum sp. 2E275]|uniref:Fur family transcriptional regulator n=1 Tax=Catenovulum sp. 2E275 TaxID=2980497 RepID=UPI0021D13327|nr:transcriptional repressor [Catenovulum sp. 2E275]MCU4677005.1 transcriptional repressor [Catenovulum sp. 2E275]
MDSSNYFLNQAEYLCKANNERFTYKRRLILKALLESQKALSAYEIIEYCKTEFNVRFPPMSVYRILEFLVEQNLVFKLEIANRYVACHASKSDHAIQLTQYLYCSECKAVKVILIDSDIINKLTVKLTDVNLSLTRKQIEMSCICSLCQN